MKVLVGCEFSGVVRDAFRARSHDAWSCDLLPSEGDSRWHLQCDVFTVLDRDWDLLIFHWPCTYLTRAQAGWFFNRPKKPKPDILYGYPRYRAMRHSARCFRRLLSSPILRIAGENPIPYRDARLIMGEPTQTIQPYQFGHTERKATCLWLRNLPLLRATDIVALPENKADAQRLHWLPRTENRWKERSRTFQGIADAMAEQWGGLR
jgi:hypothetical protein